MAPYSGYRPILDAMKTFADGESRGVVDIEDLSSKKPCYSSCLGECGTQQKQCHSGLLWFGPVSVAQVFEVMKQCSNKNVQVISGGTGKGMLYTQITRPCVPVLWCLWYRCIRTCYSFTVYISHIQ